MSPKTANKIISLFLCFDESVNCYIFYNIKESDPKSTNKPTQQPQPSQITSKRRCSFKLDQQATAKENNLEAGTVADTGQEADAQTSLIATRRPIKAKKKVNKSMSITSNVSNMSSQFQNQSCFGKLLIKCNYFVFGPDDNPMFVWLIILNVCVLYNIWLIIARQSFEKLQTEYQNYWRFADAIADSVYFIDVVVQFRTGYLEQGAWRSKFSYF